MSAWQIFLLVLAGVLACGLGVRQVVWVLRLAHAADGHPGARAHDS